MKKIATLLLMALVVFTGQLWADAMSGAPTGVQQIWQTPRQLDVPESVMYDPVRDKIYVANIAGQPTEKNGKGFISQITLDGAIEKLRWVTGLDAPKGMGIFKNTLYVTDIDRIHAIDIPSGKIAKTWDVEGAKFLNDIAIDKVGNVYISDMNANVLYAIKNAKISLLTALEQPQPNGLLMQGSHLLVGTAEGVLSVDTASKTVQEQVPHKGGIDGLKHLGNGKYIVSDWQGKVQLIEKGKSPIILSDTTKAKINAADFELVPEKKMILVPTFFDNRVVAYRLK